MADAVFTRPLLSDSRPKQACVSTACGIRLDISRQRLTNDEFGQLKELYEQRGVQKAFQRMIKGEIVNVSEHRAALHTLLRANSSRLPIFKEVVAERRRMLDFARRVRNGEWRGCRGDVITDVINVGIGGSEMGPHAVYHALRSPDQRIRVHFLSSVDGILMDRVLAECKAKSTLVVVSSKSFKTRETQVNAAAVDQWLLDNGIVGRDRYAHMVLATSNPNAANLMLLPQENVFTFWDWVGGRFSVWGAVGLPVAIALGEDVFNEFLQGAAEMDRHTATAPFESNLPAQLAMLSFYNTRALSVPSFCFLSYDERLRIMAPWLQQLEMESLGKHHDTNGDLIKELTGQLVWGYSANEGQHSFFQWLREGTGNTAIDIIWSEMPGHRYAELYRVLQANARAQTEALIARSSRLPFFNAVNVLAMDAVTPRRLGSLMAMYEHKTTMLGTLFNINPFDQPGVELGKRLSSRVERGESVETSLVEEVKASID
ncbi:MAG: glucose-6-phosphate isomerase [Sutterella sp.]|nr:glucose-6-phosphate isomerase [Sutterella sp.]